MDIFIIIGAINALAGLILMIFAKQLGRFSSRLGKSLMNNGLFASLFRPIEKLYEEKNSIRFMLILGAWLIIWGAILAFVIPILTQQNS